MPGRTADRRTVDPEVDPQRDGLAWSWPSGWLDAAVATQCGSRAMACNKELI